MIGNSAINFKKPYTKSIEVFCIQLKMQIRLIGGISRDNAIPLSQRNEKVINLVDNYFEAIDPSFNNHVALMEKQLEATPTERNYYDYLFNSSTSLIKSLCPLVKALVFNDESFNKDLLKAIKFFKNNESSIDNNTSLNFLKNKQLIAFQREDKLPDISKFKVLLLSQIDQSLRDRTLTLNYSYRFVPDSYFLIPDKEWNE